MSDQEPLDTNQSQNAVNVMESLGEPAQAAAEIDNPGTLEGTSNNTTGMADPLYVQKRLKQQSRQHEREMREMQGQMAQMHAQLNQGQSAPHMMGDGNSGAMTGDDQIQRAVNFALQQRELNEQKQRNAESLAHVQKQQKELLSHLDSMGDKYDDFHEKVFSDDLPVTPTMRDYALTLPRKGSGSAGEVLYHLASNPEELKRISKLHPVTQASEMAKLSHALISGGENKISQTRAPIGNIKSSPAVGSGGINDKTPVSSIRAKMKAGGWK